MLLVDIAQIGVFGFKALDPAAIGFFRLAGRSAGIHFIKTVIRADFAFRAWRGREAVIGLIDRRTSAGDDESKKGEKQRCVFHG